MLLFIDGFDHYVTADITEMWTQIYSDSGSFPSSNVTISANGRRSTNSLRFRSAGNADDSSPVGKTITTSQTTVIVGFAFTASGTNGSFGLLQPATTGAYTMSPSIAAGYSLNAAVPVLVGFRKLGLTQVGIILNQNGTMSAARGNGTFSAPYATTADKIDAVLGTTDHAIQWGQTYYIEVKVKVHASAGTVDIRVNGDSWLSLSGQNTLAWSSGCDEILIGMQRRVDSGAEVTYWDYDDLYIADIDSSNINNTTVDFLGDVALTWRSPTADGAMTDFDPSTGVTHYPNVDDNPPNDDTDYNSTSVAGEIDTFAIENAPVSGVNAIAVAVIHSAKRTTAGSTSTAGVIRIGATNYAGTAVGNTTTYTYNEHIVTVKPSDQSAISQADFDAFEVGYKKVA